MSGRSFSHRTIATVMLLLALLIVPGVLRPARGNAPIALAMPTADARLSVMTYNVEGLPWPVRFGRDSALEQIGTRLSELRAAGRQPHIVVLQEAFSDSAKKIGEAAGYRYIVKGPSADLAGAAARTPDQIAFAAATSFFKGEESGKLADSGLMILSDYPIVNVRRMAFPAYACAGYDCLANKGAVMATIAVPGMNNVVVVDTHLNSKAASGTSKERSNAAYRYQVEALDGFIRANMPANAQLILAGDFNMGMSKDRRATIAGAMTAWRAGAANPDSWNAMQMCAADNERCSASLSADARLSLKRSKDLQITSAALSMAMAPRSVTVPFGHESDGTMLSDHVGYVVNYGIKNRMPARS